mmetsp:Transcript_2569/g.7657  ORF Transcript_2569/g.7657 Transcript_2569/m.7657 type:complete len:247 (-) Transcript_2569:136-876(-)
MRPRRRHLNSGLFVLILASSDAVMWDGAKGVFAGDRAMTPQSFELPQPLWIFGYASLVWRPETGWETFERKTGVCEGWCRLFAQRSTDHRGTPEKPGLVCTMLPEETVRALDLPPDATPELRTRGTCYRVPDDQAAAVLAVLDFREKGGYTRQVARVVLDDVSDNGGASHVIEALVYSATADNPNFSPELASTAPEALAKAAAIIATSTGPSGANTEYLFKLADACPDDVYLQALSLRVRGLLSSQ